MSLIIAENVSQSFGETQVLHNASFTIPQNARIGLVGPNGEGKTTLLRIIGGMLDSTAGSVHRRRGLTIGYLPQDPPALEAGHTIHDAMLASVADLKDMEREIADLADQMSKDHDPKIMDRYGELHARFEHRGGYDIERRIERVLEGLGFGPDMFDRPLGELSGGQRTRAYLATLLLKGPDLLMLDEPTNHLDMDAVEWLVNWLPNLDSAFIVVSHDRYFLDRVTTTIWEIEFATLTTYKGNYARYQVQRNESILTRTRLWEAQQAFIAKTQEFIRIHIAGQRTKEAQGRRTRLERFMREEAIPRPREHKSMHLKLLSPTRTGNVVLRAKSLSVGYPSTGELLAAEELEVQYRDRVAIIGPNGIGKTTLLKTLVGELPPLSGTVKHGSGVEMGYLSQTHTELDPDKTALESVQQVRRAMPEETARGILGALLLSGDDVLKTVSQLSGGQRSRVLLGRLMARNTNVLVLDEPTNHLDIASTEEMQDALKEFEGTLIFVSHDRYLVQAVATQVWAIEGNRIRHVEGGWDGYLAWREELQAKETESERKTEAPKKEDRRDEHKDRHREANLRQKMKRRFDTLEKNIVRTEAELAKLNEEISVAAGAGDMPRVTSLGEEYRRKDGHLKNMWREWESLGEDLA